MMWSPLCPFWYVKYLNFGHKLPIRTIHHTFLESRHPEVTKIDIMFCPPSGTKKGISSWTKTISCISVLIEAFPCSSSLPDFRLKRAEQFNGWVPLVQLDWYHFQWKWNSSCTLSKRQIIENVDVRLEKEGLQYLFLSFLYFAINFRIFRVSELFTELGNDKDRSKLSFPYIILTSKEVFINFAPQNI